MMKSLKLLNRIYDILEGSRFYVVAIRDYEITFQGHFHSGIVKKMKELKFSPNIKDGNNYVEGRRKVAGIWIEITLTE